jgi:large subunit ribosomal protein L25
LHFEGGEEAPGVTMDGGILSFLVMELDVTCLPKDLPEYISVDVSQLGLNQSVHLSDIQLPEGVELTSAVSPEDEDITLANVAPPKVMEEEGAEDALAAESEEEAGGDGAPDASGDAEEKSSED